jgi:acetyl-CoA acetyltransferase
LTVSGQAAVVGIGETEVSRRSGATAGDLQSAAARLALDDAGLTLRDVDAFFTKSMNEEPVFMHSLVIAEQLGLTPAFTSAMDSGGTTCVTMLATACAGIATGLFEVALCVAGGPDATFRRRLPDVGLHRGGQEFQVPSGIVGAIPEFAMVARRRMFRFGTTSEDLAHVAVATRANAALNPNAIKRSPISVDDVLGSRSICEPLHMLDCSIPVDGAGAFVVTSAARARDLRQPPAYVTGLGGSATHRFVSETPIDEQSAVALSGKQAFTMAGLGPCDIDVAELYDCFTITTLVQLEDLGFCERGAAGAFAAEGRTSVGGSLPVNTHGGLLSQGHVDGMLHVIEAVRQIRGQAGLRQVADCDVAIATGVGGSLSSHATAVLARFPVS